MVVPASITAIATGCRLVGRSTISPQPRSGDVHAPRPQRSRLTANGGVSMTPCSTPCPAGRRTKGRGQSRRASTPGAAGSTASGHRGCGVSAPDGRTGIRRRKAAFADSRAAGEPAIVVAVRGCTESSLLRRSCRIRSSLDKDGYYVARAQFFYADEDVFFRRRNVRLGSAPAARKGEQVHAIAGQAFWDAKSPSTLLGSSVAKLNPCE